MALVDRVADALTDQVAADGKALQVVLVQDIPAALDIAVLAESLVHLEVVAPAGQLQAVEAPRAGLLSQHLKR